MRATLEEAKEHYLALDLQVDMEGMDTIATDKLIAIPYAYDAKEKLAPLMAKMATEEFTAVCPWTGLPDTGQLLLSYMVDKYMIELKSLKYYLMSFRNVGIVQEDAARRILDDIVSLCQPHAAAVDLNYGIRGGIQTDVRVTYGDA